MTLWFLLAMMTGAAVFAVLWPLGRRHAALATGHEVRVYRDQLDEIARDQAAGRIGEAEAEAARIEVSRRLLGAAETGVTEPAASPLWRRRAVALSALIMVPVLSGGLYLALGSPSLPGQPLAARINPQGSLPIDQLVAQVEAHLEKSPQDGRGWEVIAPVYAQLGRYEDAARAWRNAVTYSGASAAREANLGEALAASAKGIVTAEAKQAFERAAAFLAHGAAVACARVVVGGGGDRALRGRPAAFGAISYGAGIDARRGSPPGAGRGSVESPAVRISY